MSVKIFSLFRYQLPTSLFLLHNIIIFHQQVHLQRAQYAISQVYWLTLLLSNNGKFSLPHPVKIKELINF